MFTSFLIKYAEIGVKGKNRYLFEDALVRQIRHVLRRCDGEFKVHKTQGRIYVDALTDFDADETVEALQTVFGISGICPVVVLEDQGFEQLGRDVISYIGKVYMENRGAQEGMSFKVVARRARNNYPLHSMEINAQLGGILLDAFPALRVDVHEPDIYLHVEIREKIYVYSRIIPGPGGMPVGTNGKGMLLLSGEIGRASCRDRVYVSV